MYCPKCGQLQISEEARFCSRCGFQLGVIAEILPTDGVLQNFYPPTEESLSLYRRITSQVGAKLIFSSIVLVPFAVLIGMALDTPAFLIPLFCLFLIGLIQILYVLIFSRKTSFTSLPAEAKNFKTSDTNSNLFAPQAATVPILEIKNLDTNEMFLPPSVTEPTTRLLEIKSNSDELIKTHR